MKLERLVTSLYNEDTIAHLHRYAFALNFIERKDVLDLACGEGYGSLLMSKLSNRVIGVDIDSQIIEHAKKNIKKITLFLCNHQHHNYLLKPQALM